MPIAYLANFATQGSVARLVYLGPNNHPHEMAYTGNNPGWAWADLLNIAAGGVGATPAAGTPIAYLTNFATQGATARVVYRGTDNNIWELNYVGPRAPGHL